MISPDSVRCLRRLAHLIPPSGWWADTATLSRVSRQHRYVAAVCAAAAGIAMMTGCATGQIAETANVEAAVPGVNADAGPVAVRNIGIEYPSGDEYQQGSDARLVFSLINDGSTADRLVEISTRAASSVTVNGSTDIDLQVGAGDSVHAYGSGAKVLLADLQRSLRSGQNVDITFRFASAGSTTVPVAVVAPTDEIEQPSGSTPPPLHD